MSSVLFKYISIFFFPYLLGIALCVSSFRNLPSSLGDIGAWLVSLVPTFIQTPPPQVLFFVCLLSTHFHEFCFFRIEEIGRVGKSGLLHKHEDMSFVLRNHVKMPGMVTHTHNTSAWEDPRGLLASPASLIGRFQDNEKSFHKEAFLRMSLKLSSDCHKHMLTPMLT